MKKLEKIQSQIEKVKNQINAELNKVVDDEEINKDNDENIDKIDSTVN